ncbi:restriction endonuclease [Mycobacterium paraense]|uniref:restriction endonuclease n=1 Tax=Mycobacterium paraense TaxID=767916 RepID=UPI000A15B3F1|nr:restriction endonuclease [Mycobacterium paraense]
MLGAEPAVAFMSPNRRRSSSGDDGALIVFLIGAAVVVLAIAWPWFLGTYLAVKFGAADPSPARTITGWVFEAAYLAFLASIPVYVAAKRAAAQKLALAEAAEQERIAAKARAEEEKRLLKVRAEAAKRAAEEARIAAKARAEAAEREAAAAKAWQRERWTDDVNLAGDDLARVLAVDGIDPQVDAENARIEAQVRALSTLLARGLENLPSTAAGTDVPAGYREGDPNGVAVWVKSILTTMRPHLPDGFDANAKLAYSPESRQLVVEYELPTAKVVPTAKAYRYVRSTDRLRQTMRPVAQVKSLYSGAIAQLTLLCLANVFACDTKQHIDVVVFNGVVDTIDPRTGKPTRPCLITVRTTRDKFTEIDLDRVDPAACLKHLNAGISRSPTELAPVRPVLEFSMVDPRFITETDTLGELDHRPNLMELTPQQFESLIQNLFDKIGLDTRQTRPSRDGGVDCVAYNTDPILGGKVVIQAKRYKHTVGVSAVRDLYGTLQNEGASKGILVTTSGYGRASYDFAEGKPIELFDGANLLYLLETHAGIKARIEPPDDWQDPVPDSGELPDSPQ